MLCCGQIFENSFETYKTFLRWWIITEFEHKVIVQNRTTFSESILKKLSDNDDEKYSKKTKIN